MEDERELACDLSNGAISNDLEWPVTYISVFMASFKTIAVTNKSTQHSTSLVVDVIEVISVQNICHKNGPRLVQTAEYTSRWDDELISALVIR